MYVWKFKLTKKLKLTLLFLKNSTKGMFVSPESGRKMPEKALDNVGPTEFSFR